jgi:molecular chaperone DnaJ
LRCVSPECYEKLYGSDPLEEGELDTTRGRLFRTCVRTSKKREEKKEKDEI